MIIRKLAFASLLAVSGSEVQAQIQPQTLQGQIDALVAPGGPGGGEIKLPCGTVSAPVLTLYTDVAIVGSGACTIIPSVRAYGTNDAPVVRVRLENLMIDGARDGNEYIGVDFRDVRHARVDNVRIQNVQFGVVLDSSSINNTVRDTLIDATKTCYEIVDLGEMYQGAPDPADHPNENLIEGGRCQNKFAPARGTGTVGIWIRGADNVKVTGVDFSNLDVGIKIDRGAINTVIVGTRLENMNVPIWLRAGSKRTVILGAYQSVTPQVSTDPLLFNMKLDAGVTLADFRYYGYGR